MRFARIYKGGFAAIIGVVRTPFRFKNVQHPDRPKMRVARNGA
jgi:hypothetical protein